MTISRTYSRTAGDIIEEALRDAKIIPSEQPVSAVDYENGLDSLNNVSKYWQTKGIHLWLQDRCVLPLNVGQQIYSLGPNGAPCGYEDTFFNTTLGAAGSISDTTITVASTTGMVAAPNILESSVVESTQDWEAGNSATLSVSSGLVVTNGAATDGYADYDLPATLGKTYRVRFTYTKGTSAGCTFSVLNGTTAADTSTLTASASGELVITASLDTITFRARNTSTTSTETSTVAALNYVDDETGSRVGIKLADGTRFWSYVLDVDSATQIEITDALTGSADSGDTVYSFTNQIDRPLKLFNATYASSITASEIPVNRWSRQEYTQQPVKNSQGTVTNWYYNPTLTEGKFYVWETANDSDNVVRIDVRKPLAIYNEISDVLDYPEEYLMPLKWGIAADIGPSYGVKESRQQVLEQKAFETLEGALDNDAELDSIYIGPDRSGGY